MIEGSELLSDDGAVVVMLCSQIGLGNGDQAAARPLTLKEWNGLARRIHDSALKKPAALLGMRAQEVVNQLSAGWCPIFVPAGAGAGEGNQELMNKGALPISQADLEGIDDLAEWFRGHAASRPRQAELLLMA